MISTPYPVMEEDDDWLNDTTGPNQGGATDPLTNVEYDRIASKYSDVRLSLFSLFGDRELMIGRVQGGYYRWEINDFTRRFRFFLLNLSPTFETFRESTWKSSCPSRFTYYSIFTNQSGSVERLHTRSQSSEEGGYLEHR